MRLVCRGHDQRYRQQHVDLHRAARVRRRGLGQWRGLAVASGCIPVVYVALDVCRDGESGRPDGARADGRV
jgi:hypothetical protein